MSSRRTIRELIRRARADPSSLTLHELREIVRLREELRVRRGGYDQWEASRVRSRRVSWERQNIGPLPQVADPERRERTSGSLRLFCEEYLGSVFTLPWASFHLRLIEVLERCVEEPGLYAVALPRGSGKTTLAWAAALWAVLTGRSRYVLMVAGSAAAARRLLAAVKAAVMSHATTSLRGDWPEALVPLYALEGNARRQGGQHVDGERTRVVWGRDVLVFPTLTGERLPAYLRARGVEVSPSAGAVIAATSLDANMRGQQYTRPDGVVVRPELVVLDDPQTRESARSPVQTEYRLQLLRGDILTMGGPARRVGVVVMGTVIYEGDLMAQLTAARGEYAEWEAVRVPLVERWPRRRDLWARYVALRREALEAGREPVEAVEFYRQHREEMDEGASCTWEARHPGADSAIQYAYDEVVRVGEEAFYAEYQNEPRTRQEEKVRGLTVDDVVRRTNGYRRGVVPAECVYLTGFVDVHASVLFWMVVGWDESFRGYVVDYGTWPDQGRGVFTTASLRRTLRRRYPGRGEEGAVHAGLREVVNRLVSRDFVVEGGGSGRVDRVLVDAGYLPRVVWAVSREVGGRVVEAYRGVGITASMRPMEEYRLRPGEARGPGWVRTRPRAGEVPHVRADVNAWKTRVAAALGAEPGDAGAITLFGRSAQQHRLLALHLVSEFYVETEGRGRVVREWKRKPGGGDNHWWDCLVGCAVAASVCGLRASYEAGVERRRRRRYRLEDLRRRAGASG